MKIKELYKEFCNKIILLNTKIQVHAKLNDLKIKPFRITMIEIKWLLSIMFD